MWNNKLSLPDSCSYGINILSQNAQGLKDSSKLEHLIDVMKQRNIDVTFDQETWLEGDFIKIINDYRMIHHGLAKMSSNRGERGVATITSPTIVEAYKANSEEPPLTSSSENEIDSGRFTSTNIKLN